ncbi:Cd(II)/Pb(II)-responsive transcriptional regulator [Acidovorax sp. LjRoot74]|uniref:Cd(II)/Pb(II)-responsive transcriptional regulator n=1 Tax=Acidovorax TaxID=12916 RepID=UPI002090C1F3|nr:Cd(II)/Pb(II)-responsive transcriptional regulator [Acidovorax kalamii]MCO5358814.1 Cd(II)/Pb(II)-responsive transcriptional regulator [Acidovorax kalamii]
MLRIGELAKRADCLVQTVRFYESEGLLLEPARSEGNFRLYDSTHLQRLLFIRRCRAKDMTLGEIRQLLSFRDRPELDCGEVSSLVDSHIAQVRAKIKELRELERELTDLRRSCDSARTTRECGILNGLAEPRLTSLKQRSAKPGRRIARTE